MAAVVVALIHLRCQAHILHNVTEHIKLGTREVVRRVRDIVIFLKRPTNREEFRKAARKADLKLSLDVPTRWNSTFYMLSSALAARDELDEFFNMHRDASEMQLSDEEWTEVSEIIGLLEPLEQMTRDCSASDTVTIHLGTGSIQFIVDHLERCQGSQVSYFI